MVFFFLHFFYTYSKQQVIYVYVGNKILPSQIVVMFEIIIYAPHA
jgi:hypothetical protein